MLSYGVALCVDGRVSPARVTKVLKTALKPLAEVSVKLTIEHGHGLTFIAQADGDHPKYFDAIDAFTQAAASCARALTRRAWLIWGHGGSVDRVRIAAYDARGRQRWLRSERRGLASFTADAQLKELPFSVGVPFLERSGFDEVGRFELTTQRSWSPLVGPDLDALVGVHLKGRPGWTRSEQVGGVELTHVMVQMAGVEAFGLEEIPQQCPSFFRLPASLSFPNGKTGRNLSNGVRLPCVRLGRQVLLRWGFVARDGYRTDAGTWLWVLSARGPFGHEVRAFERRDAERAAAQTREALEQDTWDALHRDDAAATLRAMKKSGASPAKLAAEAGREGKWRVFDALLKRLPRRTQMKLRAELRADDWRAATARGGDIDARDASGMTALHRAKNAREVSALISQGADLDAEDGFGRTPLHLAQSAEVVEALVKAGASLTARDVNDLTPLKSYLLGFFLSPPGPKELAAIALMQAAGAHPKGAHLAKLLAPWKKKPSHRAALAEILRAPHPPSARED